MVVISIYAGKSKVKDANDYYLGGRKIGPLATGLSAAASGRSGGTMLGNAGLAFMFGFHALWLSIGFTFIEFIGVKYFAPKLRRFTGKRNCLTVPDFLSARFNDKGNSIRAFSAILILVFMIAYLASQLLAMRLVFTAILGWKVTIGLLVAAGVIGFYCFFGGYVAVIWTDVIQAILMILTLIGLPIVALNHLGGMSGLYNAIKSINPNLVVLMPEGRYSWILGQVIGTGFMQFGLVHVVIRWMSVKTSEELETAASVDLIANTIICWGGMIIGWCGRAIFNSVENLIEANSEMVLFNVAFALIGPVLSGICVAAVFAAVMSTADSQIMVASSSLISDLFQKVIRKGNPLTDKQLLWGGRISVLVISLFGFIWAINFSEGVYLLTVFAGGVLAAGVGILMIISLVWKRTTKTAAYAAMIGGPVVTICWRLLGFQSVISEAMAGIIAAAVIIYVVSLLSPPPPVEEIDAIFSDINGNE
jgi:sodium/proline symporter